MTARRDLGPILALTGAGIALAAVIAGFIVTGGPGDARDKRLDGIVQSHVANLATMAACAYAVNGNVPASKEELEIAVERVPRDRVINIHCAMRDYPHTAETGVKYVRVDDRTVQLCGTFRRPVKEQDWSRMNTDSPILLRARPAGYFCYDLDLSSVPRTPPS
jgi:hypothetical protein